MDRSTLALKGRQNMLAVDEPRLNSLYDEALRLNPSTLTNAGALLTRVFLELSPEHFLTTLKVPVPPQHERSGRSHWSDFRSGEHTSELQSLMRSSYTVLSSRDIN